ncbi:MAG: biotin--[acetyl-CoA-carboxylase] ligase [Muribaculaceae bacterium]|nr:biotin--[acetyl-CoA-carboxylase] ligase [Muribaculaceae bacterium]
MTPSVEILPRCGSTNSELAARIDAPHGAVLVAVEQTAGRGQRGNSWEAEPGKNLTFSQLLRPSRLPAARQFELSMAVSLAIAEAIDGLLPEGVCTSIKWPNDIYIGTGKVCGILIENKLAGALIERSIAGIGINVNQQIFLSDAPNPTSIIMHNGGRDTDLRAFLADVSERIVRTFDAYEAAGRPEDLKAAYMARLMCTRGEHTFADAAHGTFKACITDVDYDGMLTLSNGCHYAFKEVTFIIPQCN